jgi:SAM-dependent methyltransferase
MRDHTLVRLTLGGYRGTETGLKKLLVRPVILRSGPHLSFVHRYTARDLTRNFPPDEGCQQIESALEGGFRSAHLFTVDRTAELTLSATAPDRLRVLKVRSVPAASEGHDRQKERHIPVGQSPWLRGLGVATAEDKIARGMEAKFRQIHRFVDVLGPLLAARPGAARGRIDVIDMGCGKGYLTFAAYQFLRQNGWPEARVRGVEARADLVELCNRVARENECGGLQFEAGTITSASIEQVDVLIALHACDTATDDAMARGIEAGASVIIVAPCCHKEVRPQLRPPAVLATALRHGILLERQSEFVTDALRAALLEWAGYEAKVFEFISPEHTNKNLMIAAVKRSRPDTQGERALRARELARFYGIRHQRLAQHLGFALDDTATA